MDKIKKNNFLFIILISALTLVLLVVGALMLYKDNSKSFASDGYIIETTTKTNNKYYFNGNTKYKANVDKKVSFQDTKSKEVAVDPASFVHYSNGNISFLKRGALVNLEDLNSPMVPYYNITTDNTIVKETDNYTVSSNDKKINIDSFIGRISDNKYIIAGNNLELKIPTKEERIKGDYFEILYVEEGIVKIDNDKISYQVTAQDSYIYVGDNITISLGDGKMFYDGDVKMLLSQITINGNENIDLDSDKKDGTGVDGTGGGGADGKENTGANGEGEGSGGDDGDGDGLGLEGLEGKIGNGNGNGEGGDKTTASPQIELIEATVTSTTIDASLQLNNATLAKGAIEAHLTNVQTGERVYSKNIDLINGTFAISKDALFPATEYALTIIETGTTEKQYFQKIFRTKELGITLEKAYATDTSLSYKIIFDENSDVTKARISIYDSNGSNKTISPNEFTVNANAADTSVTFTGLKSNSSYSVSIDTIWMNNTSYNNLYTINRIDSTLKETPTINGVKVETNTEEVKFTLSLNEVTDKDKSIVSYTYNFYKAEDITLDNDNPEVIYSVVKNDTDPLVVDLSKIKELKTGTDYRCKITAQYDDNEMIREISTDYSRNFLIKSKPSINWEVLDTTMNSIEAKLTLVDTSCSVPIPGRSCNSSQKPLKLAYYKLKDGEETSIVKTITINAQDLSKTFQLPLEGEDPLKHNTTYAIKLFGDYVDDNDIVHENIQIGDALYVTTDKSPNLHLNVIKDNKSGYNIDGEKDINNVVTFDAKLVAPKDNETIYEDIATMTLNLYSGRYNKQDKFIGSYTITDPSKIADFFNNQMTIENKLFKTKTGMQLDTLQNMISVSKYCPQEDDENSCVKALNKWYTVEVTDVYTEEERINEIKVEDNLYTFTLTPEYYLDARIAADTKNSKYITLKEIKKQDLTEEEYTELKHTVTNLDDLDKDTVVGVIIENTLNDMFVNSAFTYEKVTVGFKIKNLKTNNVISYKEDNNEINSRYSIDQGNKYVPSSKTIYLDPSDMDDGKNFTRGYKYEFSYELSFITEDGENPDYTNEKLFQTLTIKRQEPKYTQYISTSDDEKIVYKYTFTDIDNSISNKKLYYKKGTEADYLQATEALKTDGDTHNATLTFNEDNNYTFYYQRKDEESPANKYEKIDEYKFEKEKKYNNENSFTTINRNNNNLTIRLEDNDFTNRAAAFKVVLKAEGLTDYVRYFLASKLNTIEEPTGQLDDDGNPIKKVIKTIDIDYANISKFLKHPITITVYSYYDSGLVGIDQTFTNGMIFKNSKNNKYLNIYNDYKRQGNTNNYKWEATPSETLNYIGGINLLKTEHNPTDASISLYNLLLDTRQDNYETTKGVTFNEDTNLGVDFEIIPTKNGANLKYNDNDPYEGYNARVLNEANLKSTDNTYQFNEIIPTINISTNSTINSIKVDITPNGIYGDDQFKKDNTEHNKIYIDFYSDEELENKLTTTPITTDIHITSTSTGYTASIDSIEYKNLNPATKYYFTVYAYINNRYTRLFDSSSKGKYVTRTYNASTLAGKDLINNIIFKVIPDEYDGETSRKKLTWSLGLKNTENYKIRFELYKKDDNSAVKFDGTEATSCNKDNMGSSQDGYINGCYISVPKEDVNTINNHDQVYYFTGNDFVFGDGYYNLVIYAIPYTNNNYVETQKVIIYHNDNLRNINGTESGIHQTIEIPRLENPVIKAEDLTSGYACLSSNNDNCQNGYYYIQFATSVKDIHKVMKNGQYKVILKDSNGNIVNSNSSDKCKYYIYNDESTINSSSPTEKNDCQIVMNIDEINPKFRFINLNPNTQYLVELTYETYRNNVGLTDEEKIAADPYNDTIYTPSPSNIRTLGFITASGSTSKILLTHSAATPSIPNIITKVNYTISLLGTSTKVTGTSMISESTPSLFAIGSNKTLTMTIDLEESNNPNFKLVQGNNYLITTQYYYNDNGTERLFEDGLRNINNFTISLQY